MFLFGHPVAERSSDATQARLVLARPNLQIRLSRSPVLLYGLAAVFFAFALGSALLAERYGFRDVEVPLFLFAIAITVGMRESGLRFLRLYFQV
jgi:hypothetical protein